MIDGVFRHIDAKEVLNGCFLSWTLRDDYKALRFAVYESPDGHEWVLVDDGIYTDSILIKRDSGAGLAKFYKVAVTVEGLDKPHISLPIAPILLQPVARRLIRVCRDREVTLMKAHPYGAPEVTILMRRRAGEHCPNCGSELCNGSGDVIAVDCPICFGTGIVGGYYVYPEARRMLIMDPKDDKQDGPAQVSRQIVSHTFHTVFDGRLREYDLLMSGGTIFDVIQQDVAASIAGEPVAYTIHCKEWAPEDPRYPLLRTHLLTQKEQYNGHFKRELPPPPGIVPFE